MTQPKRNRLLEPRRGDVVLFLHAHPDDESLFTGGTIAKLSAAGVWVVLVTATLGERGLHDNFAGLSPGERCRRLARQRRMELRRACGALGVTSSLQLGHSGRWHDSGTTTEERRPDSLAVNVPEATADLVEIMRRVRPHVLVSYVAHGCTGHADHVACHEIALRAAAWAVSHTERLETIALIADQFHPDHAPEAFAAGGVSVDLRDQLTRKLRAVDCHESQAPSRWLAHYRERLMAEPRRVMTEDYVVLDLTADRHRWAELPTGPPVQGNGSGARRVHGALDLSGASLARGPRADVHQRFADAHAPEVRIHDEVLGPGARPGDGGNDEERRRGGEPVAGDGRKDREAGRGDRRLDLLAP
jgi:N-acetyl-1-D-myo-inositol-2-amino-2-deoxy-alpha-D-glucopyranoside deacetylase